MAANASAKTAELHLRYIQAAIGKGRGRLGSGGGSGTVVVEREAQTYQEAFLELRKIVWCGLAENTLNNGVNFLRDHGSEISQKSYDEIESGLETLLNDYADNC